jgi:hypothetical protein
LSKIHISSQLSLPINAVTQKFGILGRTGSGKSYAATKLCEEMLDAKAQIVALDPVGVWWGLRVLKTGGEAYKIPILGGLHGDIPLEPGAGALIADLIVDKAISAVVDVSNFLMNEQRKFATDFATQLFHRKKSQRSALHLFVEEAQEFVPQHVRGDVAKMVGAYERLLKLGRNFGIGATLISQRPQSVNKDVLNQTECLVVFQMTGPQERKTIESWIAEKGVDEDIREILPHLKVGECHIWSPQWLQISQTVKIAAKKTADVSSTPKPGVKPIETKQLSQVELEDLSDKMLATIERAKKEDPRELQKQVTELRRTIAMQQQIIEKRATQDMRKRVEVPVLKDSQIKRLEGAIARFEQRQPVITSNIVACADMLEKAVKPIRDAIAQTKFANTEPRSVSMSPAVAKRAGASEGPERDGHKPLMRNRTAASPSPTGSTAGDTLSPSGGLRRIMISLAQRSNGLTQSQIGVRAGLSSKGGTFSTYISRARSNGWIEGDRNLVRITPAGIEALGNFEMLPDGELLYQYWLAKLGNSGAARILQTLRDVYPNSLTKEEIGERANISSAGGTFSTYLSRLRSLELIGGSREIKASDELFDAQ